MEKQKTIVRPVSASGVGLHKAVKATVTFLPAPEDTGIVFIRVDLSQRPTVRVCAENLLTPTRSPRRTSLAKDGIEVHTIEHLMSALAGAGIDNLFVEIDNDEVPGMDGSCINFLELLEKAGLQEQEKERHCFSLKEPIYVEEEGSSLIALPSSELKVSYTLCYNHPRINAGFLQLVVTPESFKGELARARTFCLAEEAEELQRQGMGRGANYENTLVIGATGVIKNKLRYDDEFIRHKILDLLGDLYTIGAPLKAHVIALKSGHSLNLKLAGKIAAQRQRYAASGVGAGYHPVEGSALDVNEIMKILPHRQPFLFVDRILSLELGRRAVGVKNVTINDYFFKGHFPGRPVMPGVLIVEAMAQVGGVMMLAPQENRGKIAFFMAANNIKFRKPVVPGDQLVFEVEAGKIKSKTGQVHGRALVDGRVVAEADLMFALVDS